MQQQPRMRCSSSRTDPRGHRLRLIAVGSRYHDRVSVDLDAALVRRVPDIPKPPEGLRYAFQIAQGRFTVDHARELLALAEQRASEEERGEGHDFSGEEDPAAVAQIEARRARREEHKRQQREEQEAAKQRFREGRS